MSTTNIVNKAKATSAILSSAEELCSHANAYAAAHGLQVEKKESTSSSSSTYQCAPISLLPNAYPRTAFVRAQTLAKPMNVMVDRISRDAAFLRETLGGDVSRADPYTAKLLRMYEDVYATDEHSQASKGEEWGTFARAADCLGVQRSDYMLNPTTDDEVSYELKQVELNTIASSFAGLAVQVAGLHRYLVQRFSPVDADLQTFLQSNVKTLMGTSSSSKDQDEETGVPINPALERIPLAMSVAHNRYKSRFRPNTNANTETSPPLAVLFIVQSGETNTVDQRMLEFQLYKNHDIPVVRLSLTAAHTQVRLDTDTGALYILSAQKTPLYEASVIYYRAGYTPADYTDDDSGPEWTARETLERSRATKCPNLGYHLAGTKKVQQELARPESVERFLSPSKDGPHTVSHVRGAFAGLYSLGSDATQTDKDAVLDALTEGREGQYVLKPQREGGGNNYYGEEMVSMLQPNVTITTTTDNTDDNKKKDVMFGPALGEFILMQRLFPPQQCSVLLRGGQVEGQGNSISELGCFGTIVTTSEGEVVHNEYSGFLLRTKFHGVDEGGVASGFATLSSPYLC